VTREAAVAGIGLRRATPPRADPKGAEWDRDRTSPPESSVYEEAASGADVVILAVPWQAMDETLASLKGLERIGRSRHLRPYGKEVETLGR
jgi:hypothetical protein